MSPPPYVPRHPEQSVLHACVARHWPFVRDLCEAQGRPLPGFVLRDMRLAALAAPIEQAAIMSCPLTGIPKRMDPASGAVHGEIEGRL